MGTRMTFFAVDVDGFCDWISRPVGAVLFYLAEHARTEQVFFHYYEQDLMRERYQINLKRDVVHIVRGEQGKGTLTERVPSLDAPELAEPLNRYLGRRSTYDLKFLLEALAACEDVACVQLLSEGHRPWWLFSLLRAAKETYLRPPVLADLERLCALFLRGYQFRPPVYPLQPHTAAPSPEAFPILVDENPDLRLAVLSAADYERWSQIVDELLDLDPLFRDPTEFLRLEDTFVDEHVREMLRALARMHEFAMTDPRLVSFIG